MDIFAWYIFSVPLLFWLPLPDGEAEKKDMEKCDVFCCSPQSKEENFLGILRKSGFPEALFSRSSLELLYD